MAILWQDKRDICMLTDILDVPAEGNFCSEGGKAIKPQIVMDYNHHMGYRDKGDRMQTVTLSAIGHSSGQILFFHLLTWPFSIATFFIPLVGVRKFNKEISIYPHEEYVGTCWTRMENTTAIR